MIRQTGGSESGDISTRSNDASAACCIATSRDTIPSCSPSESINRTSGEVTSSLILGRLLRPFASRLFILFSSIVRDQIWQLHQKGTAEMLEQSLCPGLHRHDFVLPQAPLQLLYLLLQANREPSEVCVHGF